MTAGDMKLASLLDKEWALLKQSVHTLNLSYIKCKGIGILDRYTFEQEESFDSLTSRFARTADLFTQKVLRTSRALLHEPSMPFIDLANLCEKLQIIPSADELIEIRDLRNQIAHEYLPEVLHTMVPEIFRKTEALASLIAHTEKYLISRGWIHPDLEK